MVVTSEKRINIGLLSMITLLAITLAGSLSWYMLNHQPDITVTKQKITRAQREGFKQNVRDMLSRYTVRYEGKTPIVHPPAGSDIYLLARNYSWGNYFLELEKGKPYHLHLASLDMRHGIVVHELHLMFRIKPDEFKVVTFKPTTTGRFPLLCGEWCGLGHASMTSQILVTEPTVQN